MTALDEMFVRSAPRLRAERAVRAVRPSMAPGVTAIHSAMSSDCKIRSPQIAASPSSRRL